MSIGPFTWGAGGEKLTPSQAAARRKVADAMLGPRPVATTFGGGLAEIGNALRGMQAQAQADTADAAHADQRKSIIDAILANDGSSMTDLAGALGNDVISSDPGASAVIQALMAQKAQQQGWDRQDQLRADDRAYDAPLRDIQLQGGQLGLEKGQLELDALRNPKKEPIEVGGVLLDPDTYQPLFDSRKPDPGFRLLTPEELQGVPGLDPSKAYQAGPDNKIYEIGGGGVNVSVGGDGQRMGTIPAGMAAVPDPTNPSGFRLEAIPGGPAAQEAAAAGVKADATAGARDTVTDTITGQAQKARDLIGGFTTGAGGWAMSKLPWSDAADLNRYVSSMKSIAAAENLQAMRAARPTGGALGKDSDADIKLLQDKPGALDPASPRYPEMLDDYERTLLRIVHGPQAGDAIYEQTRPGAAPGQSQADPGVVDFSDYFK
jgi:hypothetical protein